MADGDNKRAFHGEVKLLEQPDAGAFVVWSKALVQGNTYAFAFLVSVRSPSSPGGGGIVYQAILVLDVFGFIDNDGGGGAHVWSTTLSKAWETSVQSYFTVAMNGDTVELSADVGGGGDMVSVALFGGDGVEFQVEDNPE